MRYLNNVRNQSSTLNNNNNQWRQSLKKPEGSLDKDGVKSLKMVAAINLKMERGSEKSQKGGSENLVMGGEKYQNGDGWGLLVKMKLFK